MVPSPGRHRAARDVRGRDARLRRVVAAATGRRIPGRPAQASMNRRVLERDEPVAGPARRSDLRCRRPDVDPPAEPHTLKGHPDDAPAPQRKAQGWHPVDWACEFAGTAFQLFLGFCVIAIIESDRSPLRDALPWSWLRLVVIGIAFGVLAAAVALSPIGRRSGAHLNPAVTLAFALRGHTPGRDAGGYMVAQAAGATLAAAAFVLALRPWARTVGWARTAPDPSLPAWAVVAIEAGLTCALLLTVFLMVSSPRTARWTPAAVTGALAGLIWAGAPRTGASMNPARTIGPDLVTAGFPVWWAYFAGPAAGAVAAVLLFALMRDRRTLTAKLFHDPDYPSVHATSLPAKPHRQGQQTAGSRRAGSQR
jgi:aquaporin Z